MHGIFITVDKQGVVVEFEELLKKVLSLWCLGVCICNWYENMKSHKKCYNYNVVMMVWARKCESKSIVFLVASLIWRSIQSNFIFLLNFSIFSNYVQQKQLLAEHVPCENIQDLEDKFLGKEVMVSSGCLCGYY